MAKYRDMRYASWAKREFDWDIQPDLVEISVDDPRIDLSFSAQRPLDDQRATQMAECFMPPLAAGINMAEFPDGRLVFMDGQHRWKAAKDAGQSTITVLLFKMDYEQASAFFRLKNGLAIRLVRHIESTRAAGESKDPLTTHMQAILQEYDCFLDPTPSSRKQGAVNASQAVEAIYAVDDGDLLALTLQMITGSWGNEREVLTGPVLTAVALFLAHHDDVLRSSDLRDLKEKLSKDGFEKLHSLAQSSFKRTGRGIPFVTHLEAEILSTFNSRRTSRRMPDRTLSQLGHLPDLAHLASARQTSRTVQPALNDEQEAN